MLTQVFVNVMPTDFQAADKKRKEKKEKKKKEEEARCGLALIFDRFHLLTVV